MPKRNFSITTQVLISLSIFIFGICLGLFSKFLDYKQAELPAMLSKIDEYLDLHNFLGGFAPWIVIAVCISVYSNKPIRAAINTFLFFVGMVSSYYMYSYFVAGFFPKSYAVIWIVLTLISPLCAFFCWFAKGNGIVGLLFSSGIISLLINTACVYGLFYIHIRSWLNVMMLIFGIIILHVSNKKTINSIALGIIFAIITYMVVPFHIW
ncbi:MAG: DUF6518 family protein [Aminipila sp.]